MHNSEVPLAELATGCLKIASTNFGIGMLPQVRAWVTRRGWLTEEEFRDGVALVQMYPGPFMVDLVAYVGYRLRGVRGAVVASSCLILPAFASIVALSAVYFRLGGLPVVQRLLVGLEALLIGVLLQLTLDLGARYVRSRATAVIAVIGFAALPFSINPLLVVGSAILIGLLVHVISKNKEAPTQVTPEAKAPAAGHWLPLAITAAAMVGTATLAWLWHTTLGDMTLSLMKIGSIAFGQAAIMPLLQSEVTQIHHWLTPEEFVDGLALGQATPGPPIVMASFTGYKLGGVFGAAAAAFAIFAPSVVMTMLFTELLARCRKLSFLEPVLASIMAGFVGLLAGLTLQIGTGALRGPAELTLAAASFSAIRVFRLDAIWVFAGGLALWSGFVLLGG